MEAQNNRRINPDTDGHFYGLHDMVKAGCSDCAGCSTCCTGMGESILLDPYDIYQFQKYWNLSAQELLEKNIIALGVSGSLILPHIKMQETNESCSFLDENGLCRIHAHRPGICRLFPLGRDFQNHTLSYILLDALCEKKNRTKEKVSRLIGIEPAAAYHEFVKLWHDFRAEMSALIAGASEEEGKTFNMYLLREFFIQPYDVTIDFYSQFQQKVEKYRALFR